ncbi:MAG: Rieske 2Fe-2S domain-containing protein [Thermoplasmata archaeon]
MNPICASDCPFSPNSPEALKFPLGQIHRFASTNPTNSTEEVDETKRNVLKLLGVAGLVGAGAGLVGGAIQYAQPPIVGASSYPTVQLLDIDGSPLTATKMMAEYSVETSDDVLFNYPLRNEPNFLLNLAAPPGGGGGATNVPFGVGPQKSIVAYSAICQHLGCPAPAISYYPPGTCPQTPSGKEFYIHCSCHGSTYDVTNGASNLTGPAVLPLPQVILDWHASDDTIWATGMTPGSPPVNGHFDTLSGDYPVASPVQVAKESSVILCQFPS